MTTADSVVELVDKPGSSFVWAPKIEFSDPNLRSFIEQNVVQNGLPIVVKNVSKNWDPSLFSWLHVRDTLGHLPISVRNSSESWDLSRFIDYLQALPPSAPTIKSEPTQKTIIHDCKDPYQAIQQMEAFIEIDEAESQTPVLSAKHLQCPTAWEQHLHSQAGLHPYMLQKGVGDLFGDVQEEIRPLTLGISVSVGAECTPALREFCGAVGYDLHITGPNIFWFCSSSPDLREANQFWKSCGGGIFEEDPNAKEVPIKELSKASFGIYVVDQKPGDLVITPSMAVYQRLSFGDPMIHLHWNLTAEYAYFNILPAYRSTSKRECWRIKTLAFYGLVKRIGVVDYVRANNYKLELDDVQRLTVEFPPLLRVVEHIVSSETVDLSVLDGERAQNDVVVHKLHMPSHTRVCNFCKADIFNRGYRCVKCEESNTTSSAETAVCDQCKSSACLMGVDSCLECVAEGSGCGTHRGDMLLVQHFSDQYCQGIYQRGMEAYRYMLSCLGYTAEMIENELAHCKSTDSCTSPATIAFNQIVLTKEAQKSPCHQCKLARPRHRLAYCAALTPANKTKNRCAKKYCAPCLQSKYDTTLNDCLRAKCWKCPACEGRCNCSACTSKKKQQDAASPETESGSTVTSPETIVEMGTENENTFKDFVQKPRRRTSNRGRRNFPDFQSHIPPLSQQPGKTPPQPSPSPSPSPAMAAAQPSFMQPQTTPGTAATPITHPSPQFMTALTPANLTQMPPQLLTQPSYLSYPSQGLGAVGFGTQPGATSVQGFDVNSIQAGLHSSLQPALAHPTKPAFANPSNAAALQAALTHPNALDQNQMLLMQLQAAGHPTPNFASMPMQNFLTLQQLQNLQQQQNIQQNLHQNLQASLHPNMPQNGVHPNLQHLQNLQQNLHQNLPQNMQQAYNLQQNMHPNLQQNLHQTIQQNLQQNIHPNLHQNPNLQAILQSQQNQLQTLQNHVNAPQNPQQMHTLQLQQQLQQLQNQQQQNMQTLQTLHNIQNLQNQQNQLQQLSQQNQHNQSMQNHQNQHSQSMQNLQTMQALNQQNLQNHAAQQAQQQHQQNLHSSQNLHINPPHSTPPPATPNTPSTPLSPPLASSSSIPPPSPAQPSVTSPTSASIPSTPFSPPYQFSTPSTPDVNPSRPSQNTINQSPMSPPQTNPSHPPTPITTTPSTPQTQQSPVSATTNATPPTTSSQPNPGFYNPNMPQNGFAQPAAFTPQTLAQNTINQGLFMNPSLVQQLGVNGVPQGFLPQNMANLPHNVQHPHYANQIPNQHTAQFMQNPAFSQHFAQLHLQQQNQQGHLHNPALNGNALNMGLGQSYDTAVQRVGLAQGLPQGLPQGMNPGLAQGLSVSGFTPGVATATHGAAANLPMLSRYPTTPPNAFSYPTTAATTNPTPQLSHSQPVASTSFSPPPAQPMRGVISTQNLSQLNNHSLTHAPTQNVLYGSHGDEIGGDGSLKKPYQLSSSDSVNKSHQTPLSPPLTPHASPPIASPHTTPSPHSPAPQTPSGSPPIATSPRKRRTRVPQQHRSSNPLASSAHVLHSSHLAPPDAAAAAAQNGKRKVASLANYEGSVSEGAESNLYSNLQNVFSQAAEPGDQSYGVNPSAIFGKLQSTTNGDYAEDVKEEDEEDGEEPEDELDDLIVGGGGVQAGAPTANGIVKSEPTGARAGMMNGKKSKRPKGANRIVWVRQPKQLAYFPCRIAYEVQSVHQGPPDTTPIYFFLEAQLMWVRNENISFAEPSGNENYRGTPEFQRAMKLAQDWLKQKGGEKHKPATKKSPAQPLPLQHLPNNVIAPQLTQQQPLTQPPLQYSNGTVTPAMFYSQQHAHTSPLLSPTANPMLTPNMPTPLSAYNNTNNNIVINNFSTNYATGNLYGAPTNPTAFFPNGTTAPMNLATQQRTMQIQAHQQTQLRQQPPATMPPSPSFSSTPKSMSVPGGIDPNTFNIYTNGVNNLTTPPHMKLNGTTNPTTTTTPTASANTPSTTNSTPKQANGTYASSSYSSKESPALAPELDLDPYLDLDSDFMSGEFGDFYGTGDGDDDDEEYTETKKRKSTKGKANGSGKRGGNGGSSGKVSKPKKNQSLGMDPGAFIADDSSEASNGASVTTPDMTDNEVVKRKRGRPPGSGRGKKKKAEPTFE